MMEEPAAMLGGHWGIVSASSIVLVVASTRRLPPNLTEKLSHHSKLEDEHGVPTEAWQASNVRTAFRRVPLKPTTKCDHCRSTPWTWGHVDTLYSASTSCQMMVRSPISGSKPCTPSVLHQRAQSRARSTPCHPPLAYKQRERCDV